MLIPLGMLVDAGIDLTKLKGRLIRRIENRSSGSRYGETIDRVRDAIHFETAFDYYHVKDVYILNVKKDEISKLLDHIEDLQSSIYKKLLYCKEKNIEEYNELDLAIDQVVNYAKKNKITDAKKEVRKFIDVFLV